MPRTRESERHGPAWLVQAALIARRFYLEDRSKTEIADELGLSRFKVARILDEARELGLVRVSVELPARIDPVLSDRLRERFALSRAVVVQRTDGPGDSTREDIGRVAAELLAELVTPEDVLGLTCSRSVAMTTLALTELARCPVVQLSGTLAGPDRELGSVESVRRAAVVGGGKAYPIYAPMVLPDAPTARALAGQSPIRETMARFGEVSVAMVAIGSWAPELSTVWDIVGDDDRADAAAAGALGEIAARLFDAEGAPVSSAVDDRGLGVTLDQLRAMPEVIGLAYDARRAGAVGAALRGGVVDSLVCDDGLGRALLEE